MVTPWLKKSTLKIKNPLAKFHNEILDFYDYIWPSDEEHHVKEMVL
jgi:non-canonical poly(A) RNA polymerase PAPD5/7